MGEPAEFFAEVRARLERAGATGGVVVATVVRSRGSTPRKAGARLLIDPLGPALGTIGGGCGEAEVVSRTHRVLATGVPELCEVSLLEEGGWESPSICGGVLDVWLERLGAEVGAMPRADFFAALDRARAAGRAAAIATAIAAPRGPSRERWLGRKAIVDERGATSPSLGDAGLDAAASDVGLAAIARGGCAEDEATAPDGTSIRLFAEVVSEPPELVVVGAGHVGAALVRLAAHAGFAVTAIDDRASFANPLRLPEAARVVADDPRRVLAELPRRRDRHVVLVTRGHRLDAECLEIALGLDPAYLGMIGSRRRVARIRDWLLHRGADAERVARVRAPIGLDIGAETPAEIAVAILAEIVDARRGGRAAGLAMRLPRRERGGERR